MIRVVWTLLISLNCTLLCEFADAQSLSTTLIAEGSTSLAKAAREKGDSVRGAILYAQKKLNCSGCHAQGATDLLGPDLTMIGKDVDDEFFVDSILEPSKTIKKGFESVKILTNDGRILVGRVLSEDDRTISLRDASPESRRINLPQAAIAELRPETKSTMPDALADQLDDRQQFLDLVKYLMDIAATGTDSATANPPAAQGKLEDRIVGLALLDQFNCTSCHRDNAKALFPKKQAPDLTSVATRVDPRYIQQFIADPHRSKPGTSMPDLMTAMAPGEKQSAAEAITHYLISLSTSTFSSKAIDAESASRGRELFHSVGCVACHSPRDETGSELLSESSVPLGRLDRKYELDGLVAFLKDPHSVRPSGRMPNMMLSHWEATDVANYLVQAPRETGSSEASPQQSALDQSDRGARPKSDPSLVAIGKQKFGELGCIQCHQSGGQAHGDDQPNLAARRVSAAPLDDVRIDRGCLSQQAGSWPRYELNLSQRRAVTAAIQQRSQPLSAKQQVAFTLETFRCLACHVRDGLGGVSDARDPYFHTTNPNLGPQGRMPPTLTGVGSKLKPKWMREVLVSGRAIRPYIKTRMPQFGAGNVQHLVERLATVDQPAEVQYGHHADEKEAKKVGTELVGLGGLNCVACHTFQQKPAQTMPAVDLTEMAERLQKDWFYRYMQSPQQLSPGTVMPSFWPGGKAIRPDVLDGDPKQQLEAIWLWMLDGRQARQPRGLVFEPMEILATDEAVMLRRSYQGIGKRGIGVGYPAGVNLAFDAEQMRLAMIWKGKFADPGGVWRGQGSGNVRPLGTDLIRFPHGPDFDERPWVNHGDEDRRPPDHQFTGYYLDEVQRPTFTYRLDEIEVEDYFVDVNRSNVGASAESGPSVLRRTLTFTLDQPRQNLFLRAATGRQITESDDHEFLLDNQLRIRVEEGHVGKIISPDAAQTSGQDGKEPGTHLVIPLKLPVGRSQLVLEYAW